MSTNPNTPAPWRWELNLKSKSIHLVGGRPRFDKTVMDFTRWGMQRAAPRFNAAIAGDQYNILVAAHERKEWLAPYPGREHHADWLLNVIHPDALLIAAAPTLREALEEVVSDLFLQLEPKHGPKAASEYPPIVRARLALAHAKGIQP